MRVPAAWAGSLGSKTWVTLAAGATVVTIGTPIAAVVAAVFGRDTPVTEAIMSIYVCLLATALLFLLLRTETRYRRQALYAPAMSPIRNAFSSLADASWTMVEGDGSQQAFIQKLEEALKYFADAFSIITDTSCRASIKVVSTGPGNGTVRDLSVVTLCRSARVRPGEEGLSELDRIGNNTDYLQILVKNEEHFLSNDLPAEIGQGYQNSHWDQQVIKERKFEYTAAIVWPVERTVSSDGDRPPRREITGFLCVDALATGIFHERFDIPLGSAFAQALHLALHRFRARRAPGYEAEARIPHQRSSETESTAGEVAT